MFPQSLSSIDINGGDEEDEIKIEKYNIAFKEINQIKGPNYIALQGNFFVYDENKKKDLKIAKKYRYKEKRKQANVKIAKKY